MTNYASGTGTTPLIVFRNHADRTLEIHYSPAANYTNSSDDVYDFVVNQGDLQIWNYLNQQGTYIYSPPPPLAKTPKPDLTSFAKALRTEPTFTPTIRVGLAKLLQLSGVMTDATALQQDWQDMVAVFGKDWLSPAVKSSVEAYAQKFNVPLISSVAANSDKK